MNLYDQTRTEKLIALARANFDRDLKYAEVKVLRDSANSADLPNPHELLPQAEVRATFLRWLVTDGEARGYIDPKGLRVYAATVTGSLDLDECRGLPTLEFRRCEIRELLILRSAGTSGLYLFDCELPNGISADRLIVEGPVSLVRCRLTGQIRLGGAEIKGDLNCSGAKLITTVPALFMDGASVGGVIFLDEDFESSGEIRLLGVKVMGNLDCQGAKLTAIGDAISMDGASFGGNVFFNEGFNCCGTIRLIGAEIKGDLNFVSASVTSVRCRTLRLRGDLFWQGMRGTQSSLDLMGARVGNLRDDQASWPDHDRLNLDGLVYDELTLHDSLPEGVQGNYYGDELDLRATDRIQWLLLQRKNRRLEPQPWMQLAKHLEGKGDKEGAKHVLYRFRCLQAKEREWHPWDWLREKAANLHKVLQRVLVPKTLSHPAWPYLRHPNRSWAIGFAWLEEAPTRILWFISATLLFGTLIFAGADRNGAMIPTARDSKGEVMIGAARSHYPHFEPFVYTLENTLPAGKAGHGRQVGAGSEPQRRCVVPGALVV